MKTKFTLLLLFISLIAFAQENEYELITLDGKDAYMSTKTGEIRYDIPNNFTEKREKLIKKNLTANTTENAYTSSQTHIVKKGETLFALSRKYGISAFKISKSNNISSNSGLKIGQKITIPEINYTNTHKVEQGETLYSISRKYNISVQNLKNLNKIETNNISVNQRLKVN